MSTILKKRWFIGCLLGLLFFVVYTFSLPAYYHVTLRTSTSVPLGGLMTALMHPEEWPRSLKGFEGAQVRKINETTFEIQENRFLNYQIQMTVNEAKTKFSYVLTENSNFDGSRLDFTIIADGQGGSQILAEEKTFVHSLPARWYLHIFRGYSRDIGLLEQVLPRGQLGIQKNYFKASN